ncbi:hypothetical protein ACVWZK_008843 [Bradyrhizobium sp. GM0.4]
MVPRKGLLPPSHRPDTTPVESRQSRRSAPCMAHQKNAQPPREAGRRSRRNNTALRIAPAFAGREDYRRSIYGEGIRRQTTRSGYHSARNLEPLAFRSCRKLHDLSTTRPLSNWHGSTLIELGSFAQAVWPPCPETQAAVCRRAAALAPPNTNNARLSSRRQFRMTFRKGGKIDCCDGTHPRRG